VHRTQRERLKIIQAHPRILRPCRRRVEGAHPARVTHPQRLHLLHTRFKRPQSSWIHTLKRPPVCRCCHPNPSVSTFHLKPFDIGFARHVRSARQSHDVLVQLRVGKMQARYGVTLQCTTYQRTRQTDRGRVHVNRHHVARLDLSAVIQKQVCVLDVHCIEHAAKGTASRYAPSVPNENTPPPPAGERLQKWLARLGHAPSRRTAEAWIDAGRLTINGQKATLGDRVTAQDHVMLDGQPVAADAPETRVLAYHKPVGLIATAHDPQGRPTIFRDLPRIPGLHSVGRLDLNSEGLLLLTNDGDLTLRLTHPRYEHHKRYVVHLEGGPLTPAEAAALRRGVRLEDGPARADDVRPHPQGCEMVLHEGRNRQVRRMIAAVGRSVRRLIRTEHASVQLGDLKPGHWRDLDETETAALRYAPSEAARAAKRRAP